MQERGQSWTMVHTSTPSPELAEAPVVTRRRVRGVFNPRALIGPSRPQEVGDRSQYSSTTS